MTNRFVRKLNNIECAITISADSNIKIEESLTNTLGYLGDIIKSELEERDLTGNEYFVYGQPGTKWYWDDFMSDSNVEVERLN